MSRGYEARILDGPHLFVRNVVTVAIRDNDSGAYLMRDGTWVAVPEGALPAGEYGIELPAASIEALAVAIAEWQGHTSHADTEARVLREWLAVERGRVDAALASSSHPRP